jgi:hypothetical protein
LDVKEGLAVAWELHKLILEGEACASQRSDDGWFSGGCSWYTGPFWKGEYVCLAKYKLSVTVLLSGNNGCADEADLYC